MVGSKPLQSESLDAFLRSVNAPPSQAAAHHLPGVFSKLNVTDGRFTWLSPTTAAADLRQAVGERIKKGSSDNDDFVLGFGSRVPDAQYIRARVRKVQGKTITTALSGTYDKDGKQVDYKPKDLNWDLRHKYLIKIPVDQASFVGIQDADAPRKAVLQGINRKALQEPGESA